MKDSTIRMDVHLFDLPENEILLEIIGYLSPEEWLNLRLVSKQTLYLVTQFFKYMKCLDIAYYEYFPPSLCQVSDPTIRKILPQPKSFDLLTDCYSNMPKSSSPETFKI